MEQSSCSSDCWRSRVCCRDDARPARPFIDPDCLMGSKLIRYYYHYSLHLGVLEESPPQSPQC